MNILIYINKQLRNEKWLLYLTYFIINICILCTIIRLTINFTESFQWTIETNMFWGFALRMEKLLKISANNNLYFPRGSFGRAHEFQTLLIYRKNLLTFSYRNQISDLTPPSVHCHNLSRSEIVIIFYR